MSEMYRHTYNLVAELAPDLLADFEAEDFDSPPPLRPVGPYLARWLHRKVTSKVVWLDVHNYEFLAYLRVALESRRDSALRESLREFAERDMGPLPGGLRP